MRAAGRFPGSISAPVLAGAVALGACTEQPSLCQDRTRRCLDIAAEDIEFGGAKRYEIRLTNTCHEELEFKLCFEVEGETADCRQDYLGPAQRADENIPLSRFAGRTRVFVRYANEAKACRFPLTRDVEF